MDLEGNDCSVAPCARYFRQWFDNRVECVCVCVGGGRILADWVYGVCVSTLWQWQHAILCSCGCVHRPTVTAWHTSTHTHTSKQLLNHNCSQLLCGSHRYTHTHTSVRQGQHRQTWQGRKVTGGIMKKLPSNTCTNHELLLNESRRSYEECPGSRGLLCTWLAAFQKKCIECAAAS